MKDKLTPVTLRAILFFSMFAIVAMFSAALILGYRAIADFSEEVSQVSAQAETSNSSLNNLVQTKNELEKNRDVVERASQIVSESKSYVYQDQIISDLNQYAQASGVVITNITFGDTQTTSPSSSGSPAADPSTAGVAPLAPGAPAGVKSRSATITLDNPVRYESMLNFLHLIEQSLFRMKISQVSLSSSTDENSTGDLVNSNALTIEVYIR